MTHSQWVTSGIYGAVLVAAVGVLAISLCRLRWGSTGAFVCTLALFSAVVALLIYGPEFLRLPTDPFIAFVLVLARFGVGVAWLAAFADVRFWLRPSRAAAPPGGPPPEPPPRVVPAPVDKVLKYGVKLPPTLHYGRNANGEVNTRQLVDDRGFEIIPLRERQDANDWFVTWLYRSPDIQFEFFGYRCIYDKGEGAMRPISDGWTVASVGLVPPWKKSSPTLRFGLTYRAAVVRACKHIKFALLYYERWPDPARPFAVRIKDKYWGIDL